MAKVFTYLIVMVGILLLLNMAGMPTAESKLLNAIGLNMTTTGVDSSGVTQTGSPIIVAVLTIWSLFAVAAFLPGIIVDKSNLESAVVSGFCVSVMGWGVADMISIITSASNYGLDSFVTNIAILIFIPLLVGFVFALISYWRGSD